MTERRCPDCAVGLETVTVRSSDGFTLQVETGTRDGILGKLGVSETAPIDAVCCPECGLVRFYADLE